MPRTIFSLPIVDAMEERLDNWFEDNEYHEIVFKDGEWEMVYTMISRTPLGAVYHNIKENPGYRTFVKPAFGSSLLVFELKLEAELECQCYSPMMIFGFFRKELEFKADAGFLTSYLKDGHADLLSFKEAMRAV